MARSPTNNLSPRWTLAVFLGAVALMLLVGFIPKLRGGQVWAIEAALLMAMLAVIGLSVTGNAGGVLINAQKLISLSRFQIVLWTVLLLSAYVTIVLRRMSQPDPLAVALDWRLWALMGISTTSLVGTPLLQISKMGQALAEGAAAGAAAAFGQRTEEVEQQAKGILYTNPSIDDARFTDMFGGDEVGNAQYVDLSKVQMFIFTVVAALAYGISLYRLIDGTDPAQATAFPTLDGGLLAILAISHSGYLGGKTTRQTAVVPEEKPTTPAKG